MRESDYQDYTRKVEDQMTDFVWKLDHTNNWFRNEKGRVTTNSPWPCLTYWQWTRHPDPAQFLAPGEEQPYERQSSEAAE